VAAIQTCFFHLEPKSCSEGGLLHVGFDPETSNTSIAVWNLVGGAKAGGARNLIQGEGQGGCLRGLPACLDQRLMCACHPFLVMYQPPYTIVSFMQLYRETGVSLAAPSHLAAVHSHVAH
jgi:hypothetical protein